MEHLWARDAEGNITSDVFTGIDSKGIIVREWDRAAQRRNLTRTPRDDGTGDGKWARWQVKIIGRRPDLSLKNPNQVIAEEGGDNGPAGGNINPGGTIVVNPDPIKEAGRSRRISAARAAHWQQKLKEKAGGQVNPPNPVLEREPE